MFVGSFACWPVLSLFVRYSEEADEGDTKVESGVPQWVEYPELVRA